MTPLDELRSTLEQLAREHPYLISSHHRKRLTSYLGLSVADWIQVIREASTVAVAAGLETELVKLADESTGQEARRYLALSRGAHERRLVLLDDPGAAERLGRALAEAWRLTSPTDGGHHDPDR